MASKIYYVPALGDEAKADANQLAEELKALLGDERWPIVKSGWDSHGTHTLSRILDLEADQASQEVSIWINTNSSGALTVSYRWASSEGTSFGSDGATLGSALPGAIPPGGRSAIQDVEVNVLPAPITSRMVAWLQEQAQARLGKESR